MGKHVNTVGEIHNNIQITEELGDGWVQANCLCCGQSYRYVKIALIRDKSICKNKECSNSRLPRFKDRVGEIHRNLKIVVDEGNDRVYCECIKCGHKEYYRKALVVRNIPICKVCELRANVVNRTGQIYGDLQIIEELGGKKVKCKCIKCGYEDTYYKHTVLGYGVHCRQCGKAKTTLIDMTGQTFNNLTIIKELGKQRVLCKCTDCSKEAIYIKSSVTNKKVRCKNCSLIEKYTGNIINNITVIKFAYTGRNNQRYYQCSCNNCGEELFLTREEMLRHQCNKK